MPTAPRGIRNHNPGNIEKGDPWQGLAADQSNDDRFCVFVAPEWGIRAIARLLITYQDKYGIRTVRGMITRWAPPTENRTDSYVAAVATKAGVTPDAEIDVTEYATAKVLVEAIIQHENGMQPYGAATIDKGLLLAGIDPPGRRVVSGKVDTAKTIAAVTGAVAAGATVVETAAPAVEKVDSLARAAPYGLIVVAIVVLAGVGYFLWNRRRRAT